MAKKKGDRIVIKIVDKEADENGQEFPTSVYWTRKNKRNTTEKLEVKKYNKFKRKHTLHKEAK